MKNIDNNICQMSTPLSVRKALLMIYLIYIAYISRRRLATFPCNHALPFRRLPQQQLR
jgi:hypothetical protein